VISGREAVSADSWEKVHKEASELDIRRADKQGAAQDFCWENQREKPPKTFSILATYVHPVTEREECAGDTKPK
jgi:hypothetical protein